MIEHGFDFTGFVLAFTEETSEGSLVSVDIHVPEQYFSALVFSGIFRELLWTQITDIL
jgi:hypothetical protein